MCAGVMVATVKTYQKIRNFYVSNFRKMTEFFDHHAAGQWIVNWIGHKELVLKDLGHIFHNADWFTNTEVYEEEGYLMHKGNVVLFNHHKYNRKWRF